MSSDTKVRDNVAMHAKSLFNRGYGCGSSGDISVRVDDGIIIPPTNLCMGRFDPGVLSKIDLKGNHISGDMPSKEAFLHLAMYQERPSASSIVHLHSSYSIAVSCLTGHDPTNVLPPIIAYFVMRVGTLLLVPYYPPGDRALAKEIRKLAKKYHAMLLANHGSVVAGKSLKLTVYAAEELEETAKLYLLLQSQNTSFLTQPQVT